MYAILDCDDLHLSEVNKLKLSGVKTVFCKLPDELPNAEIKKYNGVSGVLLSDVIHFLTGDEIEKVIEWVYDILIPNGKLFITVVTPYFNFLPHAENEVCPVCAFMRDEYAKGIANGDKWPYGDGLKMRQMLQEDRFKHMVKLSGIDVEKQIPEMVHPVGLELVTAIQEAGFQVLSHAMEWREVSVVH